MFMVPTNICMYVYGVILSKQMVVNFAVDIMKPGNTVTLRNAKIDMFVLTVGRES